VASLSQGRTAAAQCGLFTHKSVPVIFEPPCTLSDGLPSNFRESVIRHEMKYCGLIPRLDFCLVLLIHRNETTMSPFVTTQNFETVTQCIQKNW